MSVFRLDLIAPIVAERRPRDLRTMSRVTGHCIDSRSDQPFRGTGIDPVRRGSTRGRAAFQCKNSCRIVDLGDGCQIGALVLAPRQPRRQAVTRAEASVRVSLRRGLPDRIPPLCYVEQSSLKGPVDEDDQRSCRADLGDW